MTFKFTKRPKAQRVFNLLLVLLQFSTITSAHGDDEITTNPGLKYIPKVIYGVDNRYDTEDYPDRKFRELAKSVAGMVSKNKIVKDFMNPAQHTFFKKTAKRAYGLCEDERFALQNVLPICTGFLVAPDILVTAGHCITSEEECERYSWVFDYTEGTTKIPNENIYNCKEILSRETKDTYLTLKDYAVIKLDKKVEGRAPLKFRRKGRPNLGTPLVVIGHPIGLPQKIADGAKVKIGHYSGLFRPVRSLIRKRHYIMANVDTFVGNSGSPVFNEKSGEVEGILVEGAEDFIEDPDFLCKRSVQKKDSAFGVEEKIYRINRIDVLKDLPQ